MENRVCTKCKKEKCFKEFYKTSTTKSGYTYNCIECYQKYRDEHKEKNKLYMRNLRNNKREEINKSKRENWREKDPIKKCVGQARSRSKRKNIPFNITESDLTLPDKCPLLGCPMFPGKKGDYEQTPSLDRIDPHKGYEKGNVWIISKRANTMKSNATREELITFSINTLKFLGLSNDDIVRALSKDRDLEDKELLG